MSLIKRNIIANYVGQVWIAVAGLIFLPVYLHLIGAEAFGMVGLYTMLVSSMMIFDFGFGATATRELARLSDSQKADSRQEMRDLVRSLEILFFCIAILFAGAIYALAQLIVEHWLNLEAIETGVAIDAVRLMSLALVFQFPVILYNNCLMGLQKQVRLNGINIVIATTKYGGAVLVLTFLSADLSTFFGWQLLVTFLNCVIVFLFLWRSMPKGPRARFHSGKIRQVANFAVGVGAINILALVLMNVDKIILSGLLSLKHFGYYTLAWTLSSIIFRLVVPVTQAFFPRFAQLVQSKSEENLTHAYHMSAQLVAAVIVPASLFLAFFAFEVISTWTQDTGLATEIRWAVAMLSVGSLLNGLMRQPYHLQLAFGWTRLALITNIVAIAFIIPTTYVLTLKFGLTGAAAAWPLLNLGYILFTPGLMHRRILPQAKAKWYGEALVLPIAISATLYGVCRLVLTFNSPPSIIDVLVILLCGLLATLVTAFSLPETRRLIWNSGPFQKYTASR